MYTGWLKKSKLLTQYNSLLFLSHPVYGECAQRQHVRRTLTLTLTHTITAYSVSGNVVRVRILIYATRQKPYRKRVYRTFILYRLWLDQTLCHILPKSNNPQLSYIDLKI